MSDEKTEKWLQQEENLSDSSIPIQQLL